MEEILSHPAVQGGVAPFLAALAVVAILQFVRLGGLAAIAGFCVAVFLISGFSFSPLTSTRKIVLLGLLAPGMGMLVDFAFKPTRIGRILLALAAGAAAAWTFLSVLQQKDPGEAMLIGAGVALFLAWLVGFGLSIGDDSVRAGAMGVGLGIGGGAAAILGASALLGSYALALGAGSCAFLLWQMVTGKRIWAGATFTLTVALIAGLLLAATTVLAKLPWVSLAVLALVPLAARIPVPKKSPVFVQAIVASTYTLAVAAASCVVVWQSSRGMPA